MVCHSWKYLDVLYFHLGKRSESLQFKRQKLYRSVWSLWRKSMNKNVTEIKKTVRIYGRWMAESRTSRGNICPDASRTFFGYINCFDLNMIPPYWLIPQTNKSEHLVEHIYIVNTDIYRLPYSNWKLCSFLCKKYRLVAHRMSNIILKEGCVSNH